MNWQSLICGSYNRMQIADAVCDPAWQKTRKSLLGTSLEKKYVTLVDWLSINQYSFKSKVQVTNYVNALKRGGLI